MFLNRLPLLTAICLCILLSGAFYWQLEPIIKGLIWPNEQTMTSTSSKNTPKPSSNKIESTKRQHNIANYQLFGDALAPVEKTPIETEELPETNLRLKLTGVLAGKNNVLASALIEGPDRKTQNYRINEDVPGGATLKHVYHDRVVLERSGRLENLIFEETRSIGIQSHTFRQEPEPVTSPSPNYNTNNNIQKFNQQQTQQIKDRLSRLRSRLQNNRP